MDVMHEEVAFLRGGRARVNSDADDTGEHIFARIQSLGGIKAARALYVAQ